MRGLLPFKLLYAIRLADLGFLAKAAAYLQAIAKETEELKNLEASTGRQLLHAAFMRMLEGFSHRLLRSHYAGSKEEAAAEAEARARKGIVGRAAEALLSSIGNLLGGSGGAGGQGGGSGAGAAAWQSAEAGTGQQRAIGSS